jgi:hypothetical protein
VAGLLSSWVASPLAIAFAQAAGFANAPEVLLTLLTLGAVAPIQVLINEALVPAALVKHQRIGRASALLLTCVQALTVSSIFLYSATPSVTLIDRLLAILAGALLSHLSAIAATLQLEKLLAGRLRHRTAMLIGGAPGLVTLMAFCAIGGAKFAGLDIGYRAVYATLALPPAVQCLLLRSRDHRERHPSQKEVPKATVGITPRFLVTAIVFLAAASAVTAIRARLGSGSERFAAFTLLALNATFSLSFTLSKAHFIEGSRRAWMGYRTSVVTLACLSLMAVYLVQRTQVGAVVLFPTLLVIQVVMTATISTLRNHLYDLR